MCLLALMSSKANMSINYKNISGKYAEHYNTNVTKCCLFSQIQSQWALKCDLPKSNGLLTLPRNTNLDFQEEIHILWLTISSLSFVQEIEEELAMLWQTFSPKNFCRKTPSLVSTNQKPKRTDWTVKARRRSQQKTLVHWRISWTMLHYGLIRDFVYSPSLSYWRNPGAGHGTCDDGAF